MYLPEPILSTYTSYFTLKTWVSIKLHDLGLEHLVWLGLQYVGLCFGGSMGREFQHST